MSGDEGSKKPGPAATVMRQWYQGKLAERMLQAGQMAQDRQLMRRGALSPGIACDSPGRPIADRAIAAKLVGEGGSAGVGWRFRCCWGWCACLAHRNV